MKNSYYDFNHEEVKRMMEEAVLSLTGEPVRIYLRHPEYEDFCGQVNRGKDGRFYFDLDPGLNLKGLYDSFVHETAHIYCGHCNEQLPEEIPPETEKIFLGDLPRLKLTAIEQAAYDLNPNEIEARAMTRQIDHVLEGLARDRYGDTEIITRLRVAMNTQLPTRRSDE